ncbi:MAG TPA: choice-of-anchor Q domain-containing protein [bacterium]|nr:choice-of-anchor Q domain-containing protein [bacterium]
MNTTMTRMTIIAALAVFIASCEFVTNNDLLEQLKKDPPTGTADTDSTADTDTTGTDDLLPDSDELTPDIDTVLTCGNNQLDTGEECDGNDAHCVDSPSGRTCNNDTCECVAVCGNSIIEGDEECEAEDNIELCTEIDPANYSGGEAECDHETCKWIVSECVGMSLCGKENAVCGPGDDQDCTDIDPDTYVGGTATCNDDCDGWMTTDCSPKCTCGNGVPESFINGCATTEECDDGNFADDDGCSSDCHWEAMVAVTDLAAERTTTEPAADIISFSWTCVGPGVTGYILKKSRSPIANDADFDDAEVLHNDTISCTPGTVRTIDTEMDWYDGTWHVAIRPVRNNTTGPLSNSVTVDTDGYMALAPEVGIQFGLVGYNAYLDRAVTLNNTSALVDLIIDETTLPGDCSGKVTILSGEVSSAARVTVVPGNFHAVVLRYAPTETSSCTDGQFVAKWLSHSDDGGATFTPGQASLPVSGNSGNTPPVFTDVYFNPNPVKTSEGTTAIMVQFEDDNGLCDDGTIGNDIVEAVWDMRELGGGPREVMTNPSCSTDTHQYWYWKNIDVSSLTNGIYVIPLTLTDKGDNTVRRNVSFAVYSGTILEVGTDKTYTSIAQPVIDAQAGDIVVVHPGTYDSMEVANEDINPGGDAIIVYGIEGPGQTVIDLTDASHSGFELDSANSGFVIGGFTVRNALTGAIWASATATTIKVTVTDCRFENNIKNTDGGAIFISGNLVDLTVAHSLFIGNSAPSHTGGAIYASDVQNLLVVDTLFDGNTAQNGGAVLVEKPAQAVFDRCFFTDNTSSTQGGAILIDGGAGIVELRNSIFAHNTSTYRGAAFYITNTVSTIPTVKIYNSTIADNTAGTDAGGLYIERGDVTVKDTIIFANTAGTDLASQLYAVNENGVTVTVDNSVIGGAPVPVIDPGNKINAPDGLWTNHQNLSDDPLFTATGNGAVRYRLQPGTPCLDVGSNGSTVPQYDFLGYARQGAKNEIGAFEYLP